MPGRHEEEEEEEADAAQDVVVGEAHGGAGPQTGRDGRAGDGCVLSVTRAERGMRGALRHLMPTAE